MIDALELRGHPLAVALRAAFERHRDAVLQAPTGAGKSTIVPLALLHEEFVGGRKILMLEPRRIAARALSVRMSNLLGERVGESVGYRMRLDTRVSSRTRIEVITEGILTRMLQDDPSLDGVACLIFDEFHERNLAADLGLALALDARRELSAEFRLLIMSATIEGARVASLLGDAEVVRVPGRAYPVTIDYVGRGLPQLPGASGALAGSVIGADAIDRAVVSAVHRALRESPGDVLTFLPGSGEIRRIERALNESSLPDSVEVRPLYGELSAASQDAVLELPPAGQRRIVLATNIAETSLTIPAVTAVVDAGLVRRPRFDPATGMSRLELMRISRAASEQRAGRAGRVAPGCCYRLWSEGAQMSLTATTPAEILEADLAPLALELARWGVRDATQLQWLDPPPPASLDQARELLLRLDALDAGGSLTALGRAMAALPVHPRLGHMLLAARGLDAVALATQLAALLSERDLMRRDGLPRDPDIRSRVALLRGEQFQSGADRDAIERVRRGARELEAMLRTTTGADGSERSERRADTEELTGVLLALAYPDRIGQRRRGTEGRYLLANGRGAAFPQPVSLARAEFIVAVILDDREREARIDLAAEVSRELLERVFATHIVTEQTFGWQAREEAVEAHEIRKLDALVLEDHVLSAAGDERAAAAMLEGVRQLGIGALPWDGSSRTLQARMEFVRHLNRPELAAWPTSDDAALTAELDQWLAPYLGGVTRREHLARVPLIEALRSRLSGAQLRALDVLAPRELQVPSGTQVRIDYQDANAPCVAVRLQEVFGLLESPRIGGGTVPVTFKLLSPAQRPVQITRDLRGFWRSSYAEVRKDMRGRYPKHHWPDNPLEAEPTRKTRGSGGKPPRR